MNKRRANIGLIYKAYNFAKAHHQGQLRLSGEEYIIHPLNVAYILADLQMDDATICAALLHDVVEDTEYTREELVELDKTFKIMIPTITDEELNNAKNNINKGRRAYCKVNANDV